MMSLDRTFLLGNKSISNLFTIQIRLMQSVAQSPVDINKYFPGSVQFVATVFWRLYQTLSVLIPGHVCILQLKTCYDLLGENLDELADTCTATLVYIFCFFNIIYMQLRYDLLGETIALMHGRFRTRSAKGITYTKIDNAYFRARKFTIYWISICFTGSILWALHPLTMPGRDLPLQCWYPFDAKQPYVYEILYIIQFIAQAQLAIAFSNGSIMYVSEIIMVCGQFDILFCSLKNFIYTAEIESQGVTPFIRDAQDSHDFINEEVNQYFCSTEEYDDLTRIPRKQPSTHTNPEIAKINALKAAIKDCVQHHLIILEFCKKMETFYRPVCLVKILQIMFQLCFMAFFVVNAEANFFRMMNFASYLMLTTMELTLFTYFGEILFRHSVRVGDAIARSEWYRELSAIGKDITIILSHAYIPIKFTLGNFFVMDIEMWKAVLKSAFSFFTLLQNLK